MPELLNTEAAVTAPPALPPHKEEYPMNNNDTRLECKVCARIPARNGISEYRLCIYRRHDHKQSLMDKEHFAMIFSPFISSKSLNSPQHEETAESRLIRGALPLTDTISDTTILNIDDDDKDNHEKNSLLVRVHSCCFTGESLFSARCDCGYQLEETMKMMSSDSKGGIIVYLSQEGRGIGILDKLKAYNLQDMGHDTVNANLKLGHPVDGRTYGDAAEILKDLGVFKCRLLTNNPLKISSLNENGVVVDSRIPLFHSCDINTNTNVNTNTNTGVDVGRDKNSCWWKGKELKVYLETKQAKMGHLF